MKTAFLYAGQGSQRVGMGKDFYDEYESFRTLIDSCEKTMPELELKRKMFEGPIEELSKTENTQACMAAFAAGITKLLKENEIHPDEVCGLSLGEYGAFYAAGVFDAEDYIRLTAYRGRVMAKAYEGISCAMSAVIGAQSALVERLCNDYDGPGFVTVTNFNCPGQYVICGDEEAVTAVENRLKEEGVKRTVRLMVSGPFHSKYMAPAGERLKEYFEKMDFKSPEVSMLLNVTGDYYNGKDDLKDVLVKQVQNAVRMEDQIRRMIENGVKRFIEIGPGNVLSGFVKKTAKAMGVDVTIIGIDKTDDLKKLLCS